MSCLLAATAKDEPAMARPESGVNFLDAAFGLGNPGARIQGLILDRNAQTKLSDLIPDTSVCAFSYMWDSTRKSVACTTCIDREPKTWVYDDQSNEWVESYPILKTATIVATTLAEENRKLKQKEEQLSQDLATARLDHELCRHEVERLRQQIRTQDPQNQPRFSWTQKFLMGLILGFTLVSLLPCSNAQITGIRTTSYNHEQFTTRPFKTWTEELLEKRIQWFKEAFRAIGQIIQIYWLEILFHVWSHWLFHLGAFVILGFFKFQNMTPTLILILLSLWSKWRTNALLPLAACDMGNLIAHCVGMIIYPFSIPLSAVLVLTMVLANIFYAVFTGENMYTVITGAMSVCVCFCINVCCDIIGIPKALPAMMFVLWKVFMCLQHKPAVVTVKDAEGKVVETSNVVPNKSGFSLWSRFKQWRQNRKKPRTHIDPSFMVPSHATCLIKSTGGTGTCFRVQNYIVTAKHVVGEDDVVEVVHEGKTHAAQVKYRHPTKDIAYCTLPADLQHLKTLKLAKEWSDGKIAIVMKSGEFVHFAASDGVRVGDEITYAVVTPDGSSGAPVIETNGRVCGVHCTNTGFSAGAVVIGLDDLPPVDNKSQEIERLKAELEKLKAMNQSASGVPVDQIVALVREAIAREMTILRKELASDDEDSAFEQKKKGKNKARKGVRKSAPKRNRKVWTEQEYKAMLEKGYTREQLQEIAEEIRKRQDEDEYWDEDEHSADVQNDTYGYPTYDDELDDQEANEIWFGQKYSKESQESKFRQIWNDEYDFPPEDVSAADIRKYFPCPQAERMNVKCKKMVKHLNDLLDRATNGLEWVDCIDCQLVIEDMVETYYKINRELFCSGLPLFFQSKNSKRAPKKTKGAQKHQ
uniref:ORF1a protein n=1 Tax=Miniopterus bat astrovirus TaxID=3141885 RepID=A0AAU7E227_9VIRU